MEKSKVIYYNIDDNLDYENKLLKDWGVTDIDLVEIKNNDKEKSFIDCVKDAKGLVVEYEQVTREVIEQLKDLKVVSLQSIGYNNVDVNACTDHNVCLTNAPGFCAEEVAVHTIGMAIDLVRKISFYDRSVRNGEWNPLLGYKTYCMTGKTFGLVFFGTIPKTMVPVLKALGMKILVYAPTKTKEYLEEFGCEKAETLDELLEKSDFVSLHCPLMPETTHLITMEQLKKMKPEAFLLNTARGAVVKEDDLAKALKTGEIKGAGIDVIEDEVNETSELFGLDNVVMTPHAAFISEDSFYDAREKALKQMVMRLSEQKAPEFLVNKEVADKLVF